MKDALQEAHDLFKSHRLEPYMTYMKTVKVETQEIKALPKKKQLAEMVLEDIEYYRAQRKIQNEQLELPLDIPA